MKLKFNIVLIGLMSLLLQSSYGHCSSSLDYTCYISNEFPLINTTSKPIFQASEKVYIYVEFTALPAGSYIIGTNWLKFTGATEQHKYTEVTIDTTTEYTYYAWFKLVEKGPVSQMFMGDEFDYDQRGKRRVVVTINSERICDEFFELL